MTVPNAASVAETALQAVFERGNRRLNIEQLRRGAGIGPNWFVCVDGTTLSVVAGDGTYCFPRPGFGAPDDYAGPFSAVEVWWPEADEPDVEHVKAFVGEHGGLAEVLPIGSTLDEWRARRTTS